jgi:hypothetical protein
VSLNRSHRHTRKIEVDPHLSAGGEPHLVSGGHNYVGACRMQIPIPIANGANNARRRTSSNCTLNVTCCVINNSNALPVVMQSIDHISQISGNAADLGSSGAPSRAKAYRYESGFPDAGVM